MVLMCGMWWRCCSGETYLTHRSLANFLLPHRLHFNRGDGTNVDYFSLGALSGDRVQPDLSLRRGASASSSLSGREGDNSVINSMMVNGQLNSLISVTVQYPTLLSFLCLSNKWCVSCG
jgi:hypothetical protein